MIINNQYLYFRFSQKQLTRRCYCSKLETTPCARGKAFQHEKDIKRDYEKKDISENDIRGNNLKTNVETIRMFEPFNRSKNLIVNPLPAVQPYPQVSVPEHNLLPAVNKSSGPGVNCIYGVEDELGKIESDEEDRTVPEPIYSEIATKATEAEDKKHKIENQSAENQLGDREESSHKLPHKKEIDYWQISTKEVAQFRPCTETFINRPNIC